MTDFDDFKELEAEDARGGLSRKLRTEGAIIAYDTALAICRDPKATSAAKASAVNSLLRAGGYFANHDADDDDKQPSEMSAEELNAAVRKVQATLEERLADRAKPTDAKTPRDPEQSGKKKKPAGGLFD